jgi:hypothetical protein
VATKHKPSQQDIDRLDLALHYQNPAASPLPQGLAADAAYESFLRGAGLDYTQAQTKALQDISAVRAQYATAVSREPQQYQADRRQINADLGDRGLWFSGERVTDLNRARVQHEQRLQDLASARAQGIQTARQNLGSRVGELARSNADAVGQLQGRISANQNQDKYINAIRQANSGGSSGGGGGFTIDIGGGTLPSSGPAPSPVQQMRPFPQQQAGETRNDYFGRLNPVEKMQLASFIYQVTPGQKDPQAALNNWLNASTAPMGQVSMAQKGINY